MLLLRNFHAKVLRTINGGFTFNGSFVVIKTLFLVITVPLLVFEGERQEELFAKYSIQSYYHKLKRTDVNLCFVCVLGGLE